MKVTDRHSAYLVQMRFLAQADDGGRGACSPFKPIEESTERVDLFCTIRCLVRGHNDRIATICWKVKSLFYRVH